jgi:hypothetical protein
MKTKQLQIRVSAEEHQQIRELAEEYDMTISEFVLEKALPSVKDRFQNLTEGILADRTYALAELNDLFSRFSPEQFSLAVEDPPTTHLSEFEANYLAAMIEITSERKGVPPPSWVKEIKPLRDPYFASSLTGLRLHLLRNAPPPFKSRNLFIDSTVGDRV